jgi:hypothetical protein
MIKLGVKVHIMNVQIAQVWVVIYREQIVTYESQTLTQAAFGAWDFPTQPFIIVLRTLRPAVTQVVKVDTDGGPSAAEEAWT